MRFLTPTVARAGAVALLLAVRLEEFWVWVVTAPAPETIRDRHRTERAAHLIDHVYDDQINGRTQVRTALRVFTRFLAGVPADIMFAADRSVARVRTSREAVMSIVRGYATLGLVIVVTLIGVTAALMSGSEPLRAAGYSQTFVTATPVPNGVIAASPAAPPSPRTDTPGPFAPPPCAAPMCGGRFIIRGPEAFGPGPVLAPPPGAGVWIAGLGFLLYLGLLVSLIALAWKLIRVIPRWRRPDNAMGLLRERYARGEIDDDEFGRRLAALR